MRITLIADIHGNFVALETVLRELEEESIDLLICLGDVGSLGPQPHEVIERLRNLDCMGVLGNTDAWLLAPPAASEIDSSNPNILYEINAWCSSQITAQDRAYLEALPMEIEIILDDEHSLLGYHGSPRSFDDIIASVTPDAEVKQMLDGHTASIMVGGHTHIQMVRRYEDMHIINTGSIGLAGVNAGGPELPMNHNVDWAEYAVLNIDHRQINIELRRTHLDMQAVLEAGRQSGMPHLDWWVGKWATS